MEITEDNEKVFKIACGSKGYQKGSQICIQYGKYSNRHLLGQYGFAIRHNKYDYFSFVVQPKALIGEIVNETQEFFEFKLKKDQVCQELISVIRALCWNPDDNVENFFEWRNKELDRIVLEFYRKAIVKELQSFDTSIEDDLKMINEEINHKLYFAVWFS